VKVLKSEVLTAVTVKVGVFWDVTSYSLANKYRRRRVGEVHLHVRRKVGDFLLWSATQTAASNKSVLMYQTTRRRIPKDNSLHMCEYCTNCNFTFNG
jgi:hypothetical protein